MPMQAGPDGVLYNSPTGGGLLSGLDPDYQSQQLQIKQAQAFKGGVPTDGDGNPDYGAMASRLMQLGDYGNADKLTRTGLDMQGLRIAQNAANDPLLTGGGSAPAAGGAAPAGGQAPAGGAPAAGAGQGGASGAVAAPSLKAANPDVVDYIRKAFASRRVSPDVALAVGATEGLRGFDPNGNANAGDGNSSFGPFQLHYGGVASGGNSVAGLGDDFTKATGLDARDPSTWKAQINFVADHVAQNGWGAFHGAKRANISNWAGIGMPGAAPGGSPLPPSMTAAAPQAAPAAAPAPPRAVAAAQPAAPAPSAALPAGAVKIDPNVDTLPPGTVTDSQYANALKVSTAAQNLDPREMSPRDQNAATLATAMVERYRQQQAAPPAGVAANGTPALAPAVDPSKPVQVAQNGASDAPAVSSVHPFGPGGPVVGSAPAQPRPQPAPAAAPPASAPPVMAPPQVAPGAQVNGAPVMTDPTMGGLLKGAWVGNPGGYALALRQKAAAYSANPFTKPTGEIFSKLADQIDQGIARNNLVTPEMKNYEIYRGQGGTGTMMQFQAQSAAEKAQAEGAARVQADTDPARIRFAGQQAEATAAGTAQGQNSPDAAAAAAAKAGQVAEASKAGAALGELPGQYAKAASAAQATSDNLDQMLGAAQGFRMGAGASMDQTARKTMQGVLAKFGVSDPALNSTTASYEDFGKIAGVLNRNAAAQVGGRTGVQEMQLIGSTLPSPEQSYDGFRSVASSLKGTADYQVAKMQAAAAYKAPGGPGNGSLNGFDAYWTTNANPSAFWLNRLSVDQPDLFQHSVQQLGQTPQGRALLVKAKTGMAWASSKGLFN